MIKSDKNPVSFPMSLSGVIKNHPTLKNLIHRLLIPKGGSRPRLWVRMFLNLFFHTRGKGSKVRFRTRMDVLPFNKFDLGQNSVIEDFCTINNGVGNVTIGNNCLIGMGNVIIGPVSVGHNVIFAQNVVMSGLNHEYKNPDIPIRFQKTTTSPIVVNDDSWIAANCVITAGVTIGQHCIIAAGSVVTKDIPAYSLAAGNPAKVIKRYDPSEKIWVRV